jgi:hypothetical protein
MKDRGRTGTLPVANIIGRHHVALDDAFSYEGNAIGF